MRRFFFDCFDGGTCLQDAYGMYLNDVSEVGDEAAQLIRSIMNEHTNAEGANVVSVSVRDDGGATVYIASCTFMGLGLATLPSAATSHPRD